jgi:hypothetical protein
MTKLFSGVLLQKSLYRFRPRHRFVESLKGLSGVAGLQRLETCIREDVHCH